MIWGHLIWIELDFLIFHKIDGAYRVSIRTKLCLAPLFLCDIRNLQHSSSAHHSCWFAFFQYLSQKIFKHFLIFSVSLYREPHLLNSNKTKLNFVYKGICFIGLKYLIDRYNIYFVYLPSRINRAIHTAAINFFVASTVLLQCNILFYIVFRSGTCIPWGFCLCFKALLFVLIFHVSPFCLEVE